MRKLEKCSKKVIACVLSALMFFSVVPQGSMTALAAEQTIDIDDSISDTEEEASADDSKEVVEELSTDEEYQDDNFDYEDVVEIQDYAEDDSSIVGSGTWEYGDEDGETISWKLNNVGDLIIYGGSVIPTGFSDCLFDPKTGFPEIAKEYFYDDGRELSLNKMIVKSGVKIIENLAFENTAFTGIELPEGLEKIEGNSFTVWGTDEFILPSTVTSAPDLYQCVTFAPIEGAKFINHTNITVRIFGVTSGTGWTWYESDNRDKTIAYVGKGSYELHNSVSSDSDFAYSIIKLANQDVEGEVEITSLSMNTHAAEELVIPEKVTIEGKNYLVTKMDGGLLSVDSNLVSLTMPGRMVENTKNLAYCRQLERLTINGDTGEISNTFPACPNLKEIVINGDVSLVQSSAFTNLPKLTTVTVNGAVDIMCTNSFSYCEALETVEITGGIGSIGTMYTGQLFSYCKVIEEFHLRKGSHYIGYGAFDNNTVKKLYIEDMNTVIDAKAFGTSTMVIYGYTGSTAEAFVNKENVAGNTKLTFVSLGDDESASIDPMFEGYDMGLHYKYDPDTFTLTIDGYGTPKGDAYYRPEGPTYITSAPWSTEETRKAKKIIVAGEIEAISDYMFSGFDKVEEIIISSTKTTKVGYNSFYMTPAKKLIISDSVTTADNYVTGGMTNLEYLSFPATMSISKNSFVSGTSKLKKVKVTKGKGSAKNYTYQTSAGLPWNNYGNRDENGYGGTFEVELEEGIDRIGEYMFSYSKRVEGLVLPSTIVSIGSSAFYHSCIYEIEFNKGLAYIGSYAFEDAEIAEIEFKSGLVSIGANAFSVLEGGDRLTRIVFPETLVNAPVDLLADRYYLEYVENQSMLDLVLPKNGSWINPSGQIITSVKRDIALKPKKFWTNIGGCYIQFVELSMIPGAKTALLIDSDYPMCIGDTLVIPDSVTEATDDNSGDTYRVVGIDKYAFGSCYYGAVVISKGIERVSEYAFTSSDELKKIVFENPDCEIADDAIIGCPNVVIYGYKNSTAEAYAKKYDIPFVTPVKISLDCQGGESDITYLSVETGKPYGQLPLAYRDGYVFMGWFTAPEGGEKVTSTSVVDIDDSAGENVLYAQWRPREVSPIAENAVEALTESEVAAMDRAVGGIAYKMIPSVNFSKSKKSAVLSGNLMPVYGIKKDLGKTGENSAEYYIGLKINIDKELLTNAGYVELHYTQNGEKISHYPTSEALKSIRENGSWSFLLNVSGDISDIQVLLDYDGEDYSGSEVTYYLENAITIKLDGIVRNQSVTDIFGEVKENSILGVVKSNPIVKKIDTNTTALVYDSVAYTADTAAIVQEGEKYLSRTEGSEGHFVTMFVEVPESIAGTAYLPKGIAGVEYTRMPQMELIEKKTAKANALYKAMVLDEKGNPRGIQFVWAVDDGFDYELQINWLVGSDTRPSLTQVIQVKAADACYMERPNPKAMLPKSLAFDGINSSMYVGQTQRTNVKIARYYEADEVQLSFESDNPEIISVNGVTGELKALKKGAATVYVYAMKPDGSKSDVKATTKITVKEMNPPLKPVATDIRDTSFDLTWTESQRVPAEIYCVPYTDEMGTRNATWKEWFESKIVSGDASVCGNKRTVKAGVTGIQLTGLSAETTYICFIRNVVTTADDTNYYAGVVSAKITTKKPVFDQIRLVAMDGSGPDASIVNPGMIGNYKIENDVPVYTDNASTLTQDIPNVTYAIYEEVSGEMVDVTGEDNSLGVIYSVTSVSYSSSDKNIVSVDKNGGLKLGSQSGIADITVTAKDSMGVVRTSAPIRIRVIRKASSLANKNITLNVGKQEALVALIGTDVKGSANEVDLSAVDMFAFAKALQDTGYLVLRNKDMTALNFDDLALMDKSKARALLQDAYVQAAALVPGKNGISASGNIVKVPVSLTEEASVGKTKGVEATVSIKIMAMAAPIIKKSILRDTSAELQFMPSLTLDSANDDLNAAKLLDKSYYTVSVKDNVTGYVWDDLIKTNDISLLAKGEHGYSITEDSTNMYTAHICGFDANKSYSVTVIANFDADEEHSIAVASKAFNIMTQKLLMNEGGALDIKYAPVTVLMSVADADAQLVAMHEIDMTSEGGIVLNSGNTYGIFAEVAPLARLYGNEKLVWTISSGDKSAASLKVSSSTYEVQIDVKRVGDFTVTATSSVTKANMGTFKVHAIPYQSNPESEEKVPVDMPTQTMAIIAGPIWEERRDEE